MSSILQAVTTLFSSIENEDKELYVHRKDLEIIFTRLQVWLESTPTSSSSVPPNTAPSTTAPAGSTTTAETTALSITTPEITTAPETTTLSTTAPETTAPETIAPETTTPETTSLEVTTAATTLSTAPETTAPETIAPETTTPETTSLEVTTAATTLSTAPETTTLSTTAAETITPETTAADTITTETTAADTIAPETTAAETTAAETTALDTTSLEITTAATTLSTAPETTSADTTAPSKKKTPKDQDILDFLHRREGKIRKYTYQRVASAVPSVLELEDSCIADIYVASGQDDPDLNFRAGLSSLLVADRYFQWERGNNVPGRLDSLSEDINSVSSKRDVHFKKFADSCESFVDKKKARLGIRYGVKYSFFEKEYSRLSGDRFYIPHQHIGILGILFFAGRKFRRLSYRALSTLAAKLIASHWGKYAEEQNDWMKKYYEDHKKSKYSRSRKHYLEDATSWKQRKSRRLNPPDNIATLSSPNPPEEEETPSFSNTAGDIAVDTLSSPNFPEEEQSRNDPEGPQSSPNVPEGPQSFSIATEDTPMRDTSTSPNAPEDPESFSIATEDTPMRDISSSPNAPEGPQSFSTNPEDPQSLLNDSEDFQSFPIVPEGPQSFLNNLEDPQSLLDRMILHTMGSIHINPPLLPKDPEGPQSFLNNLEDSQSFLNTTSDRMILHTMGSIHIDPPSFPDGMEGPQSFLNTTSDRMRLHTMGSIHIDPPSFPNDMEGPQSFSNTPDLTRLLEDSPMRDTSSFPAPDHRSFTVGSPHMDRNLQNMSFLDDSSHQDAHPTTPSEFSASLRLPSDLESAVADSLTAITRIIHAQPCSS